MTRGRITATVGCCRRSTPLPLHSNVHWLAEAGAVAGAGAGAAGAVAGALGAASDMSNLMTFTFTFTVDTCCGAMAAGDEFCLLIACKLATVGTVAACGKLLHAPQRGQ